LYVETVYLDNESTNLILYFPNSQQTAKPANIGSARIRGWEFTVATSIGGSVRISANYTRLDTEDTSDIPYYNGNELAGRPRDDAMVAASWSIQRWNLTWEAHYIGSNFLDQANMIAVDARNIHNVIAQLDVPVPGLTFSVEARNVTNDRASDVAGYPLPGRSFYTTLSFRR
jgi:iron complex outermembrane receptor protein